MVALSRLLPEIRARVVRLAVLRASTDNRVETDFSCFKFASHALGHGKVVLEIYVTWRHIHRPPKVGQCARRFFQVSQQRTKGVFELGAGRGELFGPQRNLQRFPALTNLQQGLSKFDEYCCAVGRIADGLSQKLCSFTGLDCHWLFPLRRTRLSN